LASLVVFEDGDGFMEEPKKKAHSKRIGNLNPWKSAMVYGASLTIGTRSAQSAE
jgi:hypothetical protein